MAHLDLSQTPAGTSGRVPFWRQPTVQIWLAIGAVASLCVFILPFAFPPTTPSQSASYAVGFGNRVAMLSTVFVSAAVAILLWWRRIGARITDPPEQGTMPLSWLAWASAAAIIFHAFLGWRVAIADVYYCDASYFLTQVGRHLHDHAVLYKDIEFAYGPLLFYWPELFIRVLAPLGLKAPGAYMVSLTVMQLAGLGIIFYAIQSLPLTRRLKGVAMLTMAFGTLTPLLGLNYTLLRFALPYAGILWITAQAGVWRQSILFGLAQILMLSISPELGVAFAGGAGAYGLYRAAMDRDSRWLAACAAPLVGLAVAAVLLGRNYFEMMLRFAGGNFAGVIEAKPHLEILLLAAIALSPFAIAGYVRRYGREAGPMIGLYIAALGMVPAGLGRCDELHTFFAGIGVLLLSLVAVSAYQNVWSTVWVALFIVSAVYSTASQAILYKPLEKQVISGNIWPDNVDVAHLEAVTGGAKIAAPFKLPIRVMEALTQNGQFAPGYFCFMINSQDIPGQERKIAEMRQVPYVLFPTQDYRIFEMGDNRRRFVIMRFGITYTKKHVFNSGELLEQEVAKNWQRVEDFGGYTLYRQK
ncbi:hypothetical protein [Granulicella sibirica]|uniref:Arabinofuranosyltransferase AftA N-terminal domain-containing protein n=1 Tax=Granulicella sibirica TaxID=2479048 RepID=A0A4Q0T675_9BACT|nr:hypothetical protein [Granulicella sibirica]RXH58472.1 hypothetical protein GRAN_1782 [Granulicella sibirica]